jgi:hypothetical protein
MTFARNLSAFCAYYILTLPLLFLLPLCLFAHLPMRPLIPGIASLLSLTSLILSLLTLLISFLALPQNPSVLLSYYTLGHIPLTTSLSSAPIILMGTPQSCSLHLILMRLTSTPWNTPPFATNTSVLLITLMVVIDWPSSYSIYLSYLLHLHGSPIDPFLLSPCVSAIISLLLFPSFLLFPCVSAHLLWAHYCSQFSMRLCLLLYIRPSCRAPMLQFYPHFSTFPTHVTSHALTCP